MKNQDLIHFLKNFNNSPNLTGNIPFWEIYPARLAVDKPFPSWIHPYLREALEKLGITKLYSHQLAGIDCIQNGENVELSTGTASGKSLCYQIPIIQNILTNQRSNALLLFPTKALTNDQLNSFNELNQTIASLHPEVSFHIAPSVYDGDTPSSSRSFIRENTNILLTNPDMLHLGILPHHTNWANYLKDLRFIVIDEIHIYRGVFGSHVANVIRRLKRILDFYGAKPTFILTSATISNPVEHAQRLIGEAIHLIDEDGSPKGIRNFLFYNPPVINEELGVRQGLISTSLDFVDILLNNKIQTLLFTRSRRAVELIVHAAKKLHSESSSIIRGYRCGYLKTDRREIENGLKNGTVCLAIATNALELGVDIGGMDLVIMAGYPGTITSTRQRAGRAGRKNNESAAIFIASASPLDQFLCKHPEYVIDKDPESALIDPNNPLILINQIQCASFEFPFIEGDTFGSLSWEELVQYLEILQTQGCLVNKGNRFFWLSESYPASNISLRSAETNTISLELNRGENKKVIGVVDYTSSLWMTHPGAIYLHEGETYLVDSLDLERSVAELSSVDTTYFTEPVKNQEIQVIRDVKVEKGKSCDIHFSEIEVNSRIVSYKKIDWETKTILSIEPLDLPDTRLRTFGYWISINEKTVERMREEKMWLSDTNDYGPAWNKIRDSVRSRDNFTCQNCGLLETGKPHHVHHKIPFRLFSDPEKANEMDNLVTLCPSCHRLIELNVRIRSAISGLNYSLYHLAPLFVMCDENDLGSYGDPSADFADRQPVVLLYDTIPAGLGLSESLFCKHHELLTNALDLIEHCECQDGCPSCVGPTVEAGLGGKNETKFLINLLLNERLIDGFSL